MIISISVKHFRNDIIEKLVAGANLVHFSAHEMAERDLDEDGDLVLTLDSRSFYAANPCIVDACGLLESDVEAAAVVLAVAEDEGN